MAKKDDDLHEEALDDFQTKSDFWADNRREALEDLRFGRLGEQWPEEVLQQRQRDGKPCLIINRIPAFIRQVVNDSRQNKPSIKVHPVDSGADVETANILNGLIRQIESSSNADVAYDTAVECAIGSGMGYFRVALDYAHDDSFDLDIRIERVSNPFSVYPDHLSTAADSSDWNSAFVIDKMPKDAFERQYKADAIDWEADYRSAGPDWLSDDLVTLAEWWRREEAERTILLLSTGEVIAADKLATSEDVLAALQAGGVRVERERKVKTWKVTRRLVTGAEIIETEDWPGRYIPIIPVWGDEVDVEGERHFRSLIRDAKDAQRMLNYWRSKATELVALAPIVPWIGPQGAFDIDPEKWATANRESHSYLEYKVVAGANPPSRMPLDSGPAAGALQEALNATDDLKAITGLYDASLGARSNETSGRAIMARQREGDVSTFHFTDNLSRAIRHAGRVVLDLVPHVYTGKRILRIRGEDGRESEAPVNQPVPVIDPQTKQPVQRQNPVTGMVEQMTRINDLTAGKYDVTVSAGPSFTSRREEAAFQMSEFVRVFPESAPVVGPEMAKNLDWPGADDIARKLEALSGGDQAIPPEVEQQFAELQAKAEQLAKENEQLKSSTELDAAKLQAEQQKAQTDAVIRMRELELDERRVAIEERAAVTQEYEAQTARMAALKPAPNPMPQRAA